MFLMCSETRGKKKDVLLRIKLENSRWRTASIVCKPNCCCSVVSLCLTLWSRGLQHARLPCLSPSPGACSNSCPLSWWCHLTLILCCPLLLLPSIFPNIRVFCSESALLIRWPKYWSFSFSISPSNEYSRLISFRMDWFGLLAVPGTLKSLLQYQFESINSLVLSFLYGSAAAAKSLQSCPTLCDPIDGSPPGSPVPGILQARTLEWVAIFLLQCMKVKSESEVAPLCPTRLLATPWTAAHQAPPSMGFSWQEYWSGVPLPSPTLTKKLSISVWQQFVNTKNPTGKGGRAGGKQLAHWTCPVYEGGPRGQKIPPRSARSAPRRLWPQKGGLCTPTCNSIREVGTRDWTPSVSPLGRFSSRAWWTGGAQQVHLMSQMFKVHILLQEWLLNPFALNQPEFLAPAAFLSGIWGGRAALATQVCVQHWLCPWESHFRSGDVIG